MSEAKMIARRIRALDWPEKDFIRWAMRSGIGDEVISVAMDKLEEEGIDAARTYLETFPGFSEGAARRFRKLNPARWDMADLVARAWRIAEEALLIELPEGYEGFSCTGGPAVLRLRVRSPEGATIDFAAFSGSVVRAELRERFRDIIEKLRRGF